MRNTKMGFPHLKKMKSAKNLLRCNQIKNSNNSESNKNASPQTKYAEIKRKWNLSYWNKMRKLTGKKILLFSIIVSLMQFQQKYLSFDFKRQFQSVTQRKLRPNVCKYPFFVTDFKFLRHPSLRIFLWHPSMRTHLWHQKGKELQPFYRITLIYLSD